jgi:hypothetical protein
MGSKGMKRGRELKQIKDANEKKIYHFKTRDA